MPFGEPLWPLLSGTGLARSPRTLSGVKQGGMGTPREQYERDPYEQLQGNVFVFPDLVSDGVVPVCFRRAVLRLGRPPSGDLSAPGVHV